jgi:MFS transporter, DHA2 family, multidrug resistance protein
VLPVVHGLQSLAATGPTAGAAGSLALGVVVGALFVRRQLRLDDPLLDLRLFRRRATAGTLGINLGAGVVMAGTFLLLTLWLQLVAGMSVLTVGLVLAPLQAAMVVASLLAPRLARTIRPARVMAAGLLIAATGLAVVGLLGAGAGGGTPALLAGLLLASVGIALPTALGTDLVVGSVPEEKAGSAGALSETSGELGVALGVATLGSLATAVYRDVLVLPPGTPAPLADAARTGLTETVTAGPTAQVLDAVHAAFTSGLGVAATTGAVVLAGLAGLALWAVGSVPVTAGLPAPVAPVEGAEAVESDHDDDAPVMASAAA